MRRVGVAFDPRLASADALGGAISHFTLCAVAVEFYKHRIINIRAKRAFDRLKVSTMAVCRQLNAVRQTGARSSMNVMA